MTDLAAGKLRLQALFSKLIGTSAPEVPVPDPRSFGPEVWVQERKAFSFRCENQRFSDRASFCVTQSALQDLEPEQKLTAPHRSELAAQEHCNQKSIVARVQHLAWQGRRRRASDFRAVHMTIVAAN